MEAAFFGTALSLYAAIGATMIFAALIVGAILRHKRQSANPEMRET